MCSPSSRLRACTWNWVRGVPCLTSSALTTKHTFATGDAAAAFGDFETAIRHNPNDPDIYYHRGQLYFVSNEYEKAAADYQKSTSLDDKFVFSHVQYAVAQYKLQQTRESMATFRKILKLFPDSYEPLNY